MCVMHVRVWTIHIILSQILSQSVQKCLSCPKASKMSTVKILNFVFGRKYAIQRDENSTIELSVKFCIERKLFFMAKITTLKFSPFSQGYLTIMSGLTFS